MNTIDDVGNFLRIERSRRRLTQTELADRAGIPLRTYQRLESGDAGARLSSLLAVLNALGLALSTTSPRRPTLDELDAIYGNERDE